MDLVRNYRMIESRNMGPGRKLLEVEVDDDAMRVRDVLKGREINENHGQAAGWGRALVEAMHGWGYTREYVQQTAAGAAGQLNGKGDVFSAAVTEALEEVYGK